MQTTGFSVAQATASREVIPSQEREREKYYTNPATQGWFSHCIEARIDR